MQTHYYVSVCICVCEDPILKCMYVHCSQTFCQEPSSRLKQMLTIWIVLLLAPLIVLAASLSFCYAHHNGKWTFAIYLKAAHFKLPNMFT